MPLISKQFVALSGLCVLALGNVACEPKRIPPMTVTDLMEDRVALDGVLLKCNQNSDMARNDSDCMNARVAIERLAKVADPADEAKRKADFERSRDRLRLAQDKARSDEEAKSKVDAYDLPVLPVDPAPAGNPTAPAASTATGAPAPASPPKP